MKKLFSAFLATALFLCGLYTESSFAFSEELTLAEYSTQLSELDQAYGVSSIGEIDGEKIDYSEEISLNRLIIKTNDNKKLRDDCGAIEKIEGYNGLHIMQYTSSETTELAYDYFSGLSNVECIEFDFCFRVLEPDTEYEEFKYEKNYLSWGSTTTYSNQAVQYANYLADEAPEIVVAVIDSGIDYEHSFFEDRIVYNGVNLIESNKEPKDDNGHGTHVAGIIVDNTAPNVKVSAYKTVDSNGSGTYSVTCAAIDLAVKNDVNVINMSLGWSNSTKIFNLFEESITKAVNNNIPVVVSAGNNASNASKKCPASNNNVITVASTSINNMPSGFSNYGECVDVAAPGSNITSSILNNSYGQKSGTSMATPFVSAAAAFLKTLNPQYSSEAIKNIIKDTAFVPEEWNTDYGTGILDFSEIVSTYVSSYPKISLNSDRKAEISVKSPNTIVYYTIDGSKPVVGISSVYDEPIDLTSAVSIVAIACESEKYPSAASILKINWSEDITIRYKGNEKMLLPPNSEIKSCYSSDNNIVAADMIKHNIYGVSIGEATVFVNLENGQSVTYHVTVEYAWWQWLIRIFLLGIFWY